MYSATVLDHARNPRNRGELADPDAAGEAYYHRCGDRMRLTFRLAAGKIAEVRCKTSGCGAARAAASMTTTLLEGLPLDEARRLTALQLDQALGGVVASKRHALLMVLECLHDALGPRQAPGKEPQSCQK